MLYAIICYNDEKLVSGWYKAEDDAVMERLGAVIGKVAAAGKPGPVARLQPTTHAKVLRKGKDGPVVTDGPFAETKEQLGGYYLVEAKDRDEAIAIAARIPSARWGSIEVRPIIPHEMP